MPNGYDKNWIRLCAAIDGFKVRHGHWPSAVLMPKISLNDLEEWVFTPESMAKIRETIKLVIDEDAFVVATDEKGNRYNYGDEGSPKKRPAFDARKWLAVEPDRPEPEESDF